MPVVWDQDRIRGRILQAGVRFGLIWVRVKERLRSGLGMGLGCLTFVGRRGLDPPGKPLPLRVRGKVRVRAIGKPWVRISVFALPNPNPNLITVSLTTSKLNTV